MRLAALKLIAAITSSGQIVSVVAASQSDRDDLIKRGWHIQEAMIRLAVLTAVAHIGKDLLPNVLGHGRHGLGQCKLTQWRNTIASPAQKGPGVGLTNHKSIGRNPQPIQLLTLLRTELTVSVALQQFQMAR